MRFYKILLAATLLHFASGVALAKEPASGTAYSDSSAVINGTAGSTDDYPWMVFLANEFGEQYCGASLISPTWVLTAAHCFLNEAGNAVDIETGARSNVILSSDTVSPLSSDAITGAIGQIIIHPSYQPDPDTSANKDDFDVALVELTASVTLTPVSLLAAGSSLPADTQVKVMGWGATAVNADNESIEPANSLLEAVQKIVAGDACLEIYVSGITGNMLCAGGLDANDTTDTCQGDSGGPLVVAHSGSFVQVGLSSFGGTESGPVCGDPAAPGVYANVATLAAFIAEHATDATFVNVDAATPGIALAVATSGTQLTISWNAYEGATGYIFYYAPYPALDTVGSLDVGSNLSISGELPVGSAFYVAVQPYNADGNINVFSNVANFTISE